MSKYAILSLLEEPVDGTIFNDSRLLLHLTILRPFFCDLADEYLAHTLEKVLQGKKQIPLIAISEELFGLKKDVAVIELESTATIQDLYKAIDNIFSMSITFESEQFPDYKPHITHQGLKKIEVGENIIINSISLVKLDNNSGRILTTINLA